MELTEGNSKCHLWYAILLGDTCKYDDTRVKLTKGLEFERQVKMSLDIDPYNSTALHLIGRYCYEVRYYHVTSSRCSVTSPGCNVTLPRCNVTSPCWELVYFGVQVSNLNL